VTAVPTESAGDFSAAMLALARGSRGLTQGQLAVRTGISQGAISKFEMGVLSPSEEAIFHLSRALHFPRPFFSERLVSSGLGTAELFHRKRLRVPAKTLSRVRAEVAIRRVQVARLLLAVELEHRMPRLTEDDHYLPEDIARRLRAAWLIAPGPIANLVEVIEAAGLVVIRADFQSGQIDATSLWEPGQPPLIFVNRDLPPDRFRFTLCHELGHLLMHTGTMPDDGEAEADRFAAEFLMPATDIGHMLLPSLQLDRLLALKEYWRVSMRALVMRASQLGRITPTRRKSLFARLGELGYRMVEPRQPPVEQPELLNRIFQLHITQLGYSLPELAQLLLLHVDELPDWYPVIATDQLPLFESPRGESAHTFRVV
jgi:Zn-dependent peptidase ImmA (M78 family)/DNA-binding XRE family transcriptional regulator